MTDATSGLSGGCESGTCSIWVRPDTLNGPAPIASDFNGGPVETDGTSDWVNLASVTVQTGLPGVVALTGNASVFCRTCNSGNLLADCRLGWSTTATGGATFQARQVLKYDTDGNKYHNMGINVSRGIGSGARTFYLNGRAVTSDGDKCYFENISAIGIAMPN